MGGERKKWEMETVDRSNGNDRYGRGGEEKEPLHPCNRFETCTHIPNATYVEDRREWRGTEGKETRKATPLQQFRLQTPMLNAIY